MLKCQDVVICSYKISHMSYYNKQNVSKIFQTTKKEYKYLQYLTTDATQAPTHQNGLPTPIQVGTRHKPAGTAPVPKGWIPGQLTMRGHVSFSHPTWRRGSKTAQGLWCSPTSCRPHCGDCPSPRWLPLWSPALLTHLIMLLPDQDLMGKASIFNCQEGWGNSFLMFAFGPQSETWLVWMHHLRKGNNSQYLGY